MNDEKHTPNEDWEMSVSNVSPPETAIENNGGGWKMPEPVFRVSEGDKLEKSEVRPLAAENILLENSARHDESYVLEQPNISEDFSSLEAPEQSFEPEAKEGIKAEDGNAKWVVLLGGIFIFFAGLVGIMLGVYFLFLK